MFQDEIRDVVNLAEKKVSFLNKRPAAYFILSMLAGMYVGLGMVLIFTIGGLLNEAGFAGTRVVMGVSFGIALSLVTMAGAELFTGNNMVMIIGKYNEKVSWSNAVKLWILCWLGNLSGSLMTAFLYLQTGLAKDPIGSFIAKMSLSKMSLSVSELMVRGILCNVLVCLAVWCSIKLKSESGKLIMIFWCLFAFITTGFEHSVANMTILAVGVLNPAGEVLTWGGYAYNLLFSTIGNMIGGIFLIALPYAIVAGKIGDKE